VGQGGGHPGEEIEAGEDRPAIVVLDEGGGEEEEPHVPEKVQPAAMDEHRGEERDRSPLSGNVAETLGGLSAQSVHGLPGQVVEGGLLGFGVARRSPAGLPPLIARLLEILLELGPRRRVRSAAGTR
jgi:hypothetical protein